MAKRWIQNKWMDGRQINRYKMNGKRGKQFNEWMDG
jgi:hypothetical protein